MLELAILNPRIPVSVLSSKLSSLSYFLPFSGLRTCSLCCDSYKQWVLLALNKLWTDYCHGKKGWWMLPFILELSGYNLCKAVVRTSHLVSPLRHCTEYNCCCCHLEGKHCSCGLLSCRPLRRPVAHHSAQVEDIWLPAPLGAAPGMCSTGAERGLGILVSKRIGKAYVSPSVLAP